MFLKYNSFGIIWALTIAFLSLVGVETTANISFMAIDKVIHLVMYAVLTLMFIVGFHKQYQIRVFKYNPLIWATSVTALYGVLLEFIQYFLPHRSFDYQDMFANVIGTFIGWLVFLIIYKL